MGKVTQHAALCASTVMLWSASCCGSAQAGSFAALTPGGMRADGRLSIIYDARNGGVEFESPVDLASILIESDVGVFTGDRIVRGSFSPVDREHQLFQATFGDTLRSWSFGTPAEPGLTQPFVLSDFSVVGSNPDRVTIRDADLIYIPVPEPSTFMLIFTGVVAVLATGQYMPAAVCRR